MEKNILKRYARRGQCFSTSTYIKTLDKCEIDFDYPDIKKENFIFTDGCGYISKDLAQMVAKKYGLLYSSAF